MKKKLTKLKTHLTFSKKKTNMLMSQNKSMICWGGGGRNKIISMSQQRFDGDN